MAKHADDYGPWMADEGKAMTADQLRECREEDVPCCDVCHEPLDEGCACQNEYAREHDSRSER